MQLTRSGKAAQGVRQVKREPTQLLVVARFSMSRIGMNWAFRSVRSYKAMEVGGTCSCTVQYKCSEGSDMALSAGLRRGAEPSLPSKALAATS